MDLTLISFNYRNKSTWFYEALASRDRGEAPSAVLPLLNRYDQIIVTSRQAAAIWNWCETLDGWRDYPGQKADFPLEFKDLNVSDIKDLMAADGAMVSEAARRVLAAKAL